MLSLSLFTFIYTCIDICRNVNVHQAEHFAIGVYPKRINENANDEHKAQQSEPKERKAKVKYVNVYNKHSPLLSLWHL